MNLAFAPLLHALRLACGDAWRVVFNLYKVMIPVIIGVKILVEFDLVGYVALPLKPLMGLVGLPADLGLVWAFAIIVNIYASLLVMASILPSLPELSVAQTTTFAVMVLVAHGLILESRIAQQCGVSFTGQFIIRLGGALLCGLCMHLLYSYTGALQEPARFLLPSPGAAPTLVAWMQGEALNLFYIFWVVLGLMLLQRILVYSRIDRLLGLLFSPLLMLLGLGPKAATSIVVGFCMGLLYGSGIIIKESQSGALPRKDVFCAITLIGLAHALIEDTLLMLLIDGHISGVLGLRMLFAIVFSLCLTRLHSLFYPQAPGARA